MTARRFIAAAFVAVLVGTACAPAQRASTPWDIDDSRTPNPVADMRVTARRDGSDDHGRAGAASSAAPVTSTTQAALASDTTSTAPLGLPATTSTTAAPDATTGVVDSDDGIASGLVGSWRGVYLPHGWIASSKPEAHVTDAVLQLRAAGFDHQVHNIGTFDVDGRMSADQHAGLGSWVATSRAVAPEQRVIAWVSGSEDIHVDSAQTHANIAAWLRWAVAEFDLDGVLLDFEPFSADNQALVDLLAMVRAELPDTWIATTAPAPSTRWTPDFVRRVANTVDALSPMIYDSGIEDGDSYSDWASEALARFKSSSDVAAAVIPSIPAYGRSRWHAPAAENIATAMDAVARVDGVDGAVVYWWWELDDDNLRVWLDATS